VKKADTNGKQKNPGRHADASLPLKNKEPRAEMIAR